MEKKLLLILFFFNKMAPKTLDGSAFSFTTTRGHTTHISILWVFVLFTFLAVSVVALGGFQEGLTERQLPDTKVHGELEITDGFSSQSSLIGFKDLEFTPRTAAFTADYDKVYLLGDTGAGVTAVITLPAPRENASIRFIQTADLNNTGQWTFGTAANPDFADYSFVSKKQNGVGISGLLGVVANATGDNTFEFVGGLNAGGGTGSFFDLIGVKENGVDRWFFSGIATATGDTGGADTSDFA